MYTIIWTRLSDHPQSHNALRGTEAQVLGGGGVLPGGVHRLGVEVALRVPGALALRLAGAAGVGVAGGQGPGQSAQAMETQSEQLRLVGLRWSRRVQRRESHRG